jgi:hypothetical protein
VANYNVDIGVKVRGEELKRFADQLKQTSKQVDGVNKFLDTFRKQNIRVNESISNLNAQLSKARTTFREATAGTKQQVQAAKDLLQANQNLNKGLTQQQKLLDNLSGATAKKAAADQQQLQAGLLRLETQGTRGLEEDFKTRQRFQTEFANELDKVNKSRQEENDLVQQSVEKTKQTVAQEIKKKFSIMASQKARKANFQQSVREFELENRINKVLQNRQKSQQRSQKLKSAASNALIGGAFPLLFGQGAGASVGGALGGFGGGLLGGQFGFALSLVGTSLGAAVDRFVEGARKVGEAMNENGKEFDRVQNIIGKEGANKLSAFASSTKTLSKTFGDFILGAQSGVAGLIGVTGILNNLISSMQRRIAERQVKRSNEFKTRTKGLRSQGGQGIKKRNILSEMTDVQFDLNVQNFANVQADTSFELIQAEIQGLEREAILNDDITEKMRQSLEVRFQHQDIMEKLVKAGAVISDQESDMILDLLEQKQLRQDNLDLQKFLKENAKEMRSLEDEDQKNYDDAIKKLDRLKESSNSVTKNLEDQNTINQIKLTGSEYDIALTEAKIGLTKEELALFDEEAFKIAFNNKLRIDGLTKQKQITQDIKNLLATEMSTAIKGLITGANSLNDAFRNVLNKMADAFLNIGLFGNVAGNLTKGGGLLGNIFGGLLANGGPAKAGKSYIVGERGPEMFTPGVTGRVTPNHEMGGGSTNVVVNVDASGSNVEGDEQQGRELGLVISAAIQSELVQQKRPGGLLA